MASFTNNSPDPVTGRGFQALSPEDLDAMSAPSQSAPDPVTGKGFKPISADEIDAMSNPIGMGESFARGAGQAFSLGYEPELIAAAKTGHMPWSSDPTFQAELKRQKAENDTAWNDHPWAYGGGMVASAIPSVMGAMASGPMGVAGGAARLLEGSSSLAGLAGRGLEAAGNAGTGIGAKTIGATGELLSNPITQGAIYGSSQGDDLKGRAESAVEGAVGAKIAPAIIKGATGLAGSAVKGLTRPITDAITGGDPLIRDGLESAGRQGIYVPASAMPTAGAFSSLSSKVDPFKSSPRAAAQSVYQASSILGDIGQGISHEEAGLGIVGNEQAAKEAHLDDIYAPFQNLKASSAQMPLSNLRQQIDSILNGSKSHVLSQSEITSTVGKIADQLQHAEQNGGMTFQQMKQLRTHLSDKIDWTSPIAPTDYDNATLKELRDALSHDMYDAADAIGGAGTGPPYKAADSLAGDIYETGAALQKSLGTGEMGSTPASKAFTKAYNWMRNSSGQLGALQALKQSVTAVDPGKWDTFARGVVQNKLMPKGFSYSDFASRWDDMTPQAKDIVFGQVGSGGIRDQLEDVAAVARAFGSKIDTLASQSEGQSNIQSVEYAAPLIEMASQQGLPLKSIATGGVLGAAGRYNARNVAKPNLPPSQAAQLAGAIRSTPAVSSAVRAANSAIQKAQSGAQGVGGGLAKATAPWTGYNMGAALAHHAGPAAAGLYGAWKDDGHAFGGRAMRASGGRTGIDHSAKAASLIRLAERAKKNHGKNTEPLLNLPDETITKALSVANESI